jgi:hypothetical protein
MAEAIRRLIGLGLQVAHPDIDAAYKMKNPQER